MLLRSVLFVITCTALAVGDASEESGLISGLRRLIGSNCIMVGNGVVPPFFRCNGCIIEQATACVNDMKANASGSVPAGCDMNEVKEVGNRKCCPTYTRRGSKLLPQYQSSAYPQTLACIKSVGCHLSEVYTDILDNCVSVCDKQYPDFNAHAVCTGQFGSAVSTFCFNRLAAILSIITLIVLPYMTV